MKRLVILLAVIFVVSAIAGVVSVKLLGVVENEPISIKRSYDANELSTFIVETKTADVSIICDDSYEQIEIEYTSVTGLDDSPEFEQDLGILHIKEKESYSLYILRLNRNKNSLSITLPTKQLWGLIIKTEIGDVNLSGVSSDMIDVSTDTGNITSDMTLGELQVRTSKGKVTINANALDAPISIATKGGDVTLTLPSNGEFIADVTSHKGNYTFDEFPSASYNMDSHIVKVNTLTGDIEIKAAE